MTIREIPGARTVQKGMSELFTATWLNKAQKKIRQAVGKEGARLAGRDGEGTLERRAGRGGLLLKKKTHGRQVGASEERDSNSFCHDGKSTTLPGSSTLAAFDRKKQTWMAPSTPYRE